MFSYLENSKFALIFEYFAKFDYNLEKSLSLNTFTDEENSEIVNTEQNVVSNFQLPKAEWNRGNPQIIIRNANKSYGSGSMVLDKFTMTVRQGSM